MNTHFGNLADIIDSFFEDYQKSHEHLLTFYDAEWSSPCEIGQPCAKTSDNLDLIAWQPVKRNPIQQDFEGLENALGHPIHPDIKTHYGQYWSAGLEAEAPEGHVSLLYLWNQEDRDRLIENLIGHVVACRNNKTPFSVFFACTEPDSDYFLTVENTSGVIQLEQPGKPPIKEVCGSLAEFYSRLVPSTQQHYEL